MPRSGSIRVCLIHKNIPTILTQITQTIGNDSINIENMVNKSKGDNACTILEASNADEALASKIAEIDGVVKVRIIK